MKQLLSHSTTKHNLTEYLSKKMIDEASKLNKRWVVAWSNLVKASYEVELTMLASDQEEADTKLLLHGIYLTRSHDSVLHIFSPDTDVFILTLRRFPSLSLNTCFVTGCGNKKRIIPIKPIFDSLGEKKIAALPGFHAFTGSDITGSFYGKGKLLCFKKCGR